MTSEGLIARLARELREDPVNALAHSLAATDLQSLMLHVYGQRSARRSPAELMEQYERSTRVRPSAVDTRTLARLINACLGCAPEFDALELAPVAPLGVNHVLGGIAQDNCLATIRNAEVLADPTTALALECARLRRGDRGREVRVCAYARMLRLQPFTNPAFSPHFALFALVSAGRDRGGYAFELEQLRTHLRVYLNFLAALPALGYEELPVDVAISDTERNERRVAAARSQVLEPLATEFPNAVLRLDPDREQGRTYYAGLCLRIDVIDRAGARINLADGGCTNWTRRLLTDEKERMLTSAMGLEMIAKAMRP